MTHALLRLNHVSRRFGGVLAIQDVSLEVQTGELVGLIGPNGAGKTTLINLITGVLKPTHGEIEFEGSKISGHAPHQIARSGIARTFQIVQPFPEMSVIENVTAATLFGGRAESFELARTRAAEALEQCGIMDLAEQPAAALALAQRKRLELAKGLALRPRLLLLDEVNAGLNASELDRAIVLIRSIAAKGVTVILTEHLMRLVMQLCDRIVVLHHGELIADGTPDAVVKDPHVIRAYLGSKFAADAGRAETAS